MIGGVNFQPGSLEQEQQRRQSQQGTGTGVQEAIKVLSLRLPKVVGAQAVAPSALLQSQGSGGHPNVDSIVESVLAKFFPQASQGPQQASAPSAFPVEQAPKAAGIQPQMPQNETPDFWKEYPRIVVDLPPPGSLPEAPATGGPSRPGMPTWDSPGGSNPGLPGAVAPVPDLKKQLDWLPSPGSGSDVPLI